MRIIHAVADMAAADTCGRSATIVAAAETEAAAAIAVAAETAAVTADGMTDRGIHAT